MSAFALAITSISVGCAGSLSRPWLSGMAAYRRRWSRPRISASARRPRSRRRCAARLKGQVSHGRSGLGRRRVGRACRRAWNLATTQSIVVIELTDEQSWRPRRRREPLFARTTLAAWHLRRRRAGYGRAGRAERPGGLLGDERGSRLRNHACDVRAHVDDLRAVHPAANQTTVEFTLSRHAGPASCRGDPLLRGNRGRDRAGSRCARMIVQRVDPAIRRGACGPPPPSSLHRPALAGRRLSATAVGRNGDRAPSDLAGGRRMVCALAALGTGLSGRTATRTATTGWFWCGRTMPDFAAGLGSYSRHRGPPGLGWAGRIPHSRHRRAGGRAMPISCAPGAATGRSPDTALVQAMVVSLSRSRSRANGCAFRTDGRRGLRMTAHTADPAAARSSRASSCAPSR
jgi:hypothetical protein